VLSRCVVVVVVVVVATGTGLPTLPRAVYASEQQHRLQSAYRGYVVDDVAGTSARLGKPWLSY